MKATLTAVARKLISPSIRYEMRQLASKGLEVMARACFWRWEVARFRLQQESPYEILYIGRKQQREMAKLLIAGKGEGNAAVIDSASATIAPNHVVVVSEMPTSGALSVPHYLSAVVPLGRSLEDITARYDSELRRSIRKNRPLYQMRQPSRTTRSPWPTATCCAPMPAPGRVSMPRSFPLKKCFALPWASAGST